MDNEIAGLTTNGAPAGARTLNLLIIEDVEDDALLVIRHLEKSGFDLYHERIETADELRLALAKRTWDVVLCDHGLIGFGPAAALGIIRDRGLDPPFIVVSGTIGEENAAELMRAGVHDLVLKGHLARLGPAIERELREAEVRRARATADAALDMERRLLHNLMASLPLSIYFKDRGHRYLRLNEPEVRILNAKDADAVVGKRADEFLPPDRARMRHEEEERILATGEPLLERIEEVTRKDGTVRWLAATKAPIRDHKGNVVGLVGITRDITRRKTAEDALEANETLFRAIVDYAPAAIVIKDLEGRNLVVNKAFCSWYGTTAEKIVGKTHDTFLSKEAAKRIRAQERKVLETGAMVEEERRVAYPDGVTRNVLVQKFPIRDADGKMFAVGTGILDISERKRMEERVRTKSRQLEVVLESMDQGMYAVDADMTCALINRRYAEMQGLPPELSRPGTRFEDLVRFNARKGRYGPGDVERHVRRRMATAQDNKPISYEFDLRDGRIVEIRSNPLPDGGFVRTATDITELKRKENALRDSEERFRAILESLPTAVSLKDRDGRYLVVNKTLCSWLNAEAEDVVGKTVFDMFPKRQATEIHDGDLEIFADGEMRMDETRRWFPDGKTRNLIVHRCPVRSTSGEITAVSTISTDITKRKQAEEELRKYSQSVHQSPSSVIIADTDGSIEYVNQAFTQLTGYSAEEAIGRNPRFLKSGHTPPETYEEMWMTLIAGKVWRGIFHNKRKDGSQYLAGATVFPITAEDGRVSHFVGTAQDITQRVAEQNLLKQVEKMESLGNLAGGIAHDFNNMLLPIIALTDMMLKKLPADSEHRPRLEKVVQAATRAKTLVAKILAFSRQEEAKRKPADVGDIIDETLGLLRNTLPSTVTIEEKLNLDGAKVFADDAQIGTVFMNLATNAADAMSGKPGRLTISLDRVALSAEETATLHNVKAGAYARVRFEDTGHGMDQSTMHRIFEPFFTTKEVGKGTGLGLATSFGIVTNHGGVLSVASEVGKGTTFDVYLPLMDERPGGREAALGRDTVR